MRLLPIVLSVVALAALPAGPGSAEEGAPDADLPGLARSAIAENRATCTEQVHMTKGFVSRRDVNGDGIPDVVLDYAHWMCGEDSTAFCGSAGCLLQVFVSAPGGRYLKVFDENGTVAFGRSHDRPSMTVSLAGSACGRTNAETCRTVYVWTGSRYVPSK